MPSNFIITLAAGTKLICAQAAGSLLTDKRRWEVRSVGNSSKGELVVRLGLPPVRPDRPPPPDPGMIPLTIPKIKRLLNARTARRCPGGSLSHWDAGPVSSASATTRTCGTPTPIRSATVSGTSSARLARHARTRTHPQDQPRLALERRVPHLLAAAVRPASTRLTGTNHHGNAIRRTVPAPSEPLRTRHTGHHRASVAGSQTDTRP